MDTNQGGFLKKIVLEYAVLNVDLNLGKNQNLIKQIGKVVDTNALYMQRHL